MLLPEPSKSRPEITSSDHRRHCQRMFSDGSQSKHLCEIDAERSSYAQQK